MIIGKLTNAALPPTHSSSSIILTYANLRIKAAFLLLAALAIQGCAQQNAPARIIPPVEVPYAAPPKELSQPILGSVLNYSNDQTASGFEVHGSGETIIPPVSEDTNSSAGGTITFNFVNASVTSVAQAIFGQLLKQNYTVDGGVQGTITLQTTRPISVDEVIPALETSLQMANLAVTREADGYHIVSLGNAAQAGAGSLSVAGGPQTPGYGYEVIPLRYANAASVAKLVQPLTQSNVQIEEDETHNLLIVAGTSQEREAIAANVAVFDVDWLAGMSYDLIPLQNTSAASVVKEVEGIIGGQGNPMNGVVNLIVISQLNAVLVVSQNERYLSEIKGLVQRLDQREQSDEKQVFIYRVQNGRASDMAKLLEQLLNQNSQSNGASNSNAGADTTNNNAGGDVNSSGPTAAANIPPDTNANSIQPGAAALLGPLVNSGTAANGAPSGGGSDNTPSDSQSTDGSTNDSTSPRIVADDTNNLLLVYSTSQQYQSMAGAIGELDVQPLQVMIEAAVAEVTLTNQLQYGVQYFFQSGHVRSINTLGTSNAISQVLPGFSAILSPGNNIQIALNALESITHVNVLSAPRLLVLNNQPAELQVGDEVPITTQTAQSTESNSAPLVSTIQYQPTGVILNVTPEVNSGGLIKLDISQEVSEVSATTTSTLNSPTISERKISTIVAVPDGQTIALGGLIQDNTTNGNSGIPLLDQIPFLGTLFSDRNVSGTRTELLILITPHIVQSVGSLEAVTNALRGELSDVNLQ